MDTPNNIQVHLCLYVCVQRLTFFSTNTQKETMEKNDKENDLHKRNMFRVQRYNTWICK